LLFVKFAGVFRQTISQDLSHPNLGNSQVYNNCKYFSSLSFYLFY